MSFIPRDYLSQDKIETQRGKVTKMHTVCKDQTHGGLSDGPTRCLLKEGLIASAAVRAVGLANSLQLLASSGSLSVREEPHPGVDPFRGSPYPLNDGSRHKKLNLLTSYRIL